MHKARGFALLFFLFAAFSAGGQEANVPEILVLDDMELDVGKNWDGGAANTEHVKSGRSSLKWADHEKNKRLIAKHVPKDWSKYEALEFDMFSAVANNADTILIISSENAETQGIDYWSYKIKIDWTGWKHFRVPLKSLGRARNPIGWHEIDSIYFTCSGWSCEPKPDTALWIDDLVRHDVPGARHCVRLDLRRAH